MIEGFVALYIFMLAAFTGYEVISRVPVILHTPLMSGSNFVHGIVLVGVHTPEFGFERNLDNIVARALRKTASQRYPSGDAMADDLRRYLAHQPVSARNAPSSMRR